MKLEKAATKLEALGNATRLEIFRDLVRAGSEGSPVGEIRDKLDIPASTLSHHISKLVHTGLVTQERVSRSLICRADFNNMESLVLFLAQNCCADDSEIWG
jgi:ArsR family transcriptional regulator